MSNSWYYTLVLEEKWPLSDEVFTEIIKTLGMANYSVWAPRAGVVGNGDIDLQHSGKWDSIAASLRSPGVIRGISSDGMSELEFDDLNTAKETLCSQGGLISLWKGHDNRWGEGIDITFCPGLGEIDLGGIHELLERREEDTRIAADLKSIFVALCQRLKPVYGYSRDEDRLETVLGREDVVKRWGSFKEVVKNLGQPPILFWLNYFSLSYLNRIGIESFDSVPHRKETLQEKGIFIYLAEHPWEAKMATLNQDDSYRLVVL